MRYVPLGRTGISVSRLGFGCMRFPFEETDGKKTYDIEESVRMLLRAKALGVNYFDTAPGYCETMSEVIVGKAFAGCREDVYIATKNPIENASGDDFEARLALSLERLNTDYIDFYHFWGIGLEKYETMIDVPDGPLQRALRLQDEGVLRHLSFSFHDKPENMLEILRRGDGIFASVLCQYNLLDRANEEAIAAAHAQGVGIVIMGPVGGGRLGAPSQVIQDLLPGKVQSSAEVALRFVLSNPAVDVALSGMSDIPMIEENADIASNMQPLTEQEQQRVDAMMAENKRLGDLYCTGCNYCMPCPQNINIPEIFQMMNYHRVYGLTDYARRQYAQIGKVNWMQYENADACIQCAQCEAKCPQHLAICRQLRQTHDTLTAADSV